MKARKTGILGGTFNPVHTGHLILAQDALETFGLDRVIFMPCATPPHKESKALAAGTHRLAMLRAALKGDKRFEVSRMELNRGGVSYTIDTVRRLRRLHPQDEFFFIIGTDMLPELHLWRDIYELLETIRFVAVERPGYDPDSLRIKLKAPWAKKVRADIFSAHLVDIASSDIRKRVGKGLSIRYLVPASVEMYIQRKKLYEAKESRRSKR